MKRLFFFAFISMTTLVQAQSKYETAMKTKLAQLDTSITVGSFKSLANDFERIAIAEKNQWLPYYYAALCLANAGWDNNVDKDANANKIIQLCEQAKSISNNAEIQTIIYMAATQKMLVDPQNRWNSDGVTADNALNEGEKLDPKNGRILYLRAAALYNTPEQFGGDKAKAKTLLEKALTLFNEEKPLPLHPTWGKKMTEELLAQY